MKNYTTGIITGIIISTMIYSMPAMANTIEVLFNSVRISVNGMDSVQWGEDISLSDGEKTPSSILYNGTTYLPIRKLSELSGNKIYWNGDSRTIGVTGVQKDIKEITKKPDKNGNVWRYYTFKVSEFDKNKEKSSIAPYSDFYYLGVQDEVRGYERVYRLACQTMNVTDNEIYYLRQSEPWKTNTSEYPQADLVKLPFDSDENTQDGEVINDFSLLTSYGGDVLIYNDYIFHSGHGPGTGALAMIYVMNYITGEECTYIGERWKTINNLNVIEDNDGYMVISYDLNDYGGANKREITFDKKTNSFVK